MYSMGWFSSKEKTDDDDNDDVPFWDKSTDNLKGPQIPAHVI